MNVPFVDLRWQHDLLRSEIDAAIARVIDTSAFVLGPEVERFETAFSEHVGTQHAIGTASGTSALQVALLALDVRPGDEVIVPAMTFYATGEAVALLGATPVFVDVDPSTYAMRPELVEAAITGRTRAILPVHLYGHPADMDALAEISTRHGLPILEDCAHAHGARHRGRRVGTLGAIGAFSFYPGKNLGALGEAGAVTVDDPELAERCRAFRDHGSTQKFSHRRVGLNARLSALQAAVLGVKLPHLDEWNAARRAVAARYRDRLADVPIALPEERADVEHVYHVFQVGVEARDRVAEAMRAAGIGVNLHYPVPMHLHEGFSHLGHRRGAFPVAERLAARTLSLPCYPGMTAGQIDAVADALIASLDERATPSRTKLMEAAR